jgi:hypothetical protein
MNRPFRNLSYAQILFLGYLFHNGLIAEEATIMHDEAKHKQQIVYLVQAKEFDKSFQLYREYKNRLGRHDFEVLQQIATVFIEQDARSQDTEKQLLSIFGCGLAGLSASLDVLDAGLSSPNIQTQLASLQFIARMQEDQADDLLNKAMASPFLYTRLEAAYLLAQKKAKTATGQIEALMYRIPPPLRYFFPEFFAIIGTSDAIHVLRHLMDDSFHPIRIEAILSAARHGRDDLLPPIRAASTHLNSAEQEACAAAFGYLKDLQSMKKLKKLSLSNAPNVQLAALHSLFLLGDAKASEKIIEEAKQENLFAINMLAEIPGSEETLYSLLSNGSLHVRFNAALALLHRKDTRCMPTLVEFLLRDSRDLGFQPQTSLGNSMKAWKILPSSSQHAQDSFFDLHALSLSMREMILRESIELEEPVFLKLAKLLFDTKQNDLIPLLVSLLENLRTPQAIALLKSQSQAAGAPLIRTYCNLSLFRLKEPGPYEDTLKRWIQQNKSQELIRFRPTLPWNMRLVETTFALTPEESSSLLIESFQALADRHDAEGIDFLLDAIQHGNIRNRPVLSGILIRALQ